MGTLDFYIDSNIEVPISREEMMIEAEKRFEELMTGHTDLIGASISLECISKGETSSLYQARIVIYKRPENLAVIKKESEPVIALKEALDSIEKMVRSSREKLAHIDPHRVGDAETISQELSAKEVYATYAKDQKPSDLIKQSRTEIASKLMVEHGLNQRAAYHAADLILEVAQERVETVRNRSDA